MLISLNSLDFWWEYLSWMISWCNVMQLKDLEVYTVIRVIFQLAEEIPCISAVVIALLSEVHIEKFRLLLYPISLSHCSVYIPLWLELINKGTLPSYRTLPCHPNDSSTYDFLFGYPILDCWGVLLKCYLLMKDMFMQYACTLWYC